MTLFIKKVTAAQELEQCYAIRKKVFVDGQKVPLHEELDGKDLESCHYLLIKDEQPVGVARVRVLKDYAKIERVAILDAYQGQGLGQQIMQYILNDLKINPSIISAKLSAQCQVIRFYEKLGFIVCSNEYWDAGIVHQDMYLNF
ncbi:MAG: GNAT family N-acetyltransferase, partial [bacterium]|nr:GNAT family N-acetyltransferase [bacterium]